MTAAVLEAPPTPSASPQGAGSVGGRRVTLEERLEGAWRAAQRDGVAECPVCHAAMLAAGAGARCRGCGSLVS
jgi:tRNA(Ile2) C34 agmatinyltransferase TiaS